METSIQHHISLDYFTKLPILTMGQTELDTSSGKGQIMVLPYSVSDSSSIFDFLSVGIKCLSKE
jgi:hypothetical protein